jgi:hypothetical protein
VVEWGGGQGIPDAEVTIELYAGPAVSSFVDRRIVATANTDASGTFVFAAERPGAYRLTARKTGYERGGGMLSAGNWTSADVSVDAENPRKTVRFVLARHGEVVGLVVDGETQKPVAGVRAVAWEYGFVRGRAWPMPGGSAITSADGRFRIPNLSPTDYVIALEPRMRSALELKRNSAIQGEDRLLTEFVGSDVDTVDYDYGLTYWPGGADVDSAAPFPLASGDSFNIGTLTANKVPKYRVRVSFDGDACQPNELIHLYVGKATIPAMVGFVGSAPCGRSVIIRGFAPGPYQLEAGGENSKRGTVQFVVTNQPVALSVTMSRGIEVQGKVLVGGANAAPPRSPAADLRGMRVLIGPLCRSVQNEAGTPDKSGDFVIHNVASREYELTVSGIPATYYLKEARYNDHSVSGGTFVVSESNQVQRLELVLGDAPATVAGLVTGSDGNPASQVYVALVKWPVVGRELFASVSGRQTDERGRYEFTGLAPGEYRLLAVLADDKAKLERPYMMERLLRNAEKLSLGEGQHRNAVLKVSRTESF